jgi:DNA replication protein DnaC
MDMTLVDLCKQLRVNGVYAYVKEYQPDNPELNQFLTSALQAELDKRHINRQMRLLRQAGFPTKKRFEDLVTDILPQDGRDALPVLKRPCAPGRGSHVTDGKPHIVIRSR